MSLQDFSDEEIINECFRRMYSDESDIIAVKVWQKEDIKYEAGKDFTDEDIDGVYDELNLDALTDCYDSEWNAITEAIEIYKAKKERKNDTRTVQ